MDKTDVLGDSQNNPIQTKIVGNGAPKNERSLNYPWQLCLFPGWFGSKRKMFTASEPRAFVKQAPSLSSRNPCPAGAIPIASPQKKSRVQARTKQRALIQTKDLIFEMLAVIIY